MAEKKEKQYVSDNARLMAEWNWEKNNELEFFPDQLTCGSGKKVWWKCTNGHEWESKINNRSNGYSCPYCSGHKVLPGHNDLKTTNPSLVHEWNYEKNNELLPEDVLPNSNKKVWWKCSKGHEWEATICNRTRLKSQCPYCTGRNAISGDNDLATTNPELLLEWDYNKNDIDPVNIKSGSSKKIWWICRFCGFEWNTSIKNRTNHKNGCPECANRQKSSLQIARSVQKKGSLLDHNPTLSLEWHEKNTLSANGVSEHSNQKAWWRCRTCGYEWQATISSRSAGVGCPHCAKRAKTSFPEQAIYYYVKQDFPLTINSYRDIFDDQMELDIFIPELNIGIEYDGKIWHNGEHSTSKEIRKYEICKKNNIMLIRVRENANDNCHQIADRVIVVSQKTNKYDGLTEAIIKLQEFIPLSSIISTETDQQKIRECFYSAIGDKSLAVRYPEIANEWNVEKNGDVSPYMVYGVSGDVFWWKCKNNHEWKSSISNRVKGRNCPYCSGKKVITGYNDLQTINSLLSQEWNYEKNNPLIPSKISPNSNKKVWWKCSRGHEWQATIYSRYSGCGCPFCSNQKVLFGFNDLLTALPDLARQWNYEKNHPLIPEKVMYKSTKKVWWRCSCGHEWEAQIKARARGNGCPECAKEKRKKKT